MSKYILFMLILLGYTHSTWSQVAINYTGAAADSSAMLDVSATDRGLLVPRMSTTERTAIISPATSLLVFDNDLNSFYYYDGIAWQVLIGANTVFTKNNNAVVLNTSTVDPSSQDFLLGALQLDDDTNNSHDNRLFFDKSKGAFRVGKASDDSWDETNVGDYSTAFGEDNTVSSSNSIGLGTNHLVSNANSIAMGNRHTVSGNGSVAAGNVNYVTGNKATAFGDYNSVQNNYGLASGKDNLVSGAHAAAFGINNSATSTGALAIGFYTEASNAYSFAQGWQTNATGSESTALGRLTMASGKHAVALNYYTEATGDESIALNSLSVASGNYSCGIGNASNAVGSGSFAGGNSADADGDYSFAFGYRPDAHNSYTTALGYYPDAYGVTSTAIGVNAEANSFAEVALGTYNTTSTALGTNTWEANDRILVIGNGTDFNATSNALTIYKNGTVNINEAYDLPSQDGNNNQFLTTSGNGSTNWQTFTFDDQQGLDMLTLSNTSLYLSLDNNINIHTEDLGALKDDMADHSASQNIQLNGNWMSRYGLNEGLYVGTDGQVAVNTTTTNEEATVQGDLQLMARYNRQDRHGNTHGLGDYGTEVNAIDFYYPFSGSSVERSYARISTINYNTSGTGWYGFTSRIDAGLSFYVSNDGNMFRSLELKNNGNATLSGALMQNSDRRLKTNIQTLGSVLPKLMQLNGYTYNWKAAERDSKLQIGFIAQEVQGIYPELVNEDQAGILSVNYISMVPLLLEGTKEQQTRLEALDQQVSELETAQQTADQSQTLTTLKTQVNNIQSLLEEQGIINHTAQK